MGGWHQPESVAGFNRNQWLASPEYAECIDSPKYASEWQADTAEGQKLGVSGTPTFFANGRMFVGAKSLEEMSKIIDEELAKVGGTR
jgi:protein-disulfide isomerase